MNAPSYTHLEEWFPRAPDDSRYLRLWRGAGLTYLAGQSVDATWHRDDYTVTLAHDPTGKVFERAADALLHYRFYPPDVLRAVSEAALEKRRLRVGDRIVQRIHIFRLLDMPVLDILTMNEVTAVVDEPRRQGFTYTTTQCHAEMGEWTALVERRETGDVTLTMRAVSKPGPRLPGFAHGLARRLQLRAHQRGLDAFRQAASNSL